MPFQPSNGILFAVDDFDAAVAAVKERGCPVLMDTETPVCRMAIINDTEGNILTFHKRKPSLSARTARAERRKSESLGLFFSGS